MNDSTSTISPVWPTSWPKDSFRPWPTALVFGAILAAFIVVLGVLVFVHELGHYLAARWRGVRRGGPLDWIGKRGRRWHVLDSAARRLASAQI